MDWIDGHIQTLVANSGLDATVARKLFLQHVRISIDPELLDNRTYKLAYVTSLNIISRVFPIISFDDPGESPMDIFPWGNSRPEISDEAIVARLHFGRGRNDDSTVVANCHGWKVLIDQEHTPDLAEGWNPITAIATACYAAARLTAILLGSTLQSSKLWKPFSLLDGKSGDVVFDFEKPFSIEKVHMAGIGAVGSAFLYAVCAHQVLTGDLILVDHDIVDRSNLGRYILFDQGDVKSLKVEAAEKRLAHSSPGLKVSPFKARLQSYASDTFKAEGSFLIERLVSAPDKRSTRREFQHLLPRHAWDASTGPDQVVVHWNDYDPALACLECIYPLIKDEDAHSRHVAEKLNVPFERVKAGNPIGEAEAIMICRTYQQLKPEEILGREFDSIFGALCGASELTAGDQVVLAPFPFISALAGILLYLEFLKGLNPDKFGDFRSFNYLHANPFYPLNPELRELRSSRPNCTCQSANYRDAFNKIWKLEQTAMR